MKNRKRKYHVLLSIMAIFFTALAAAVGFGFLGDTSYAYSIKFLCGFIFMMSPLCTIWLVITLFKKPLDPISERK